MPKTLQKIVTLYPKREEELSSPLNQRPISLFPPIPDRVIVSGPEPGTELTHSIITTQELESLDNITGNIQERLVALETTIGYMVPGICQPWESLSLAISTETTVFTYTVPVDTIYFIDRCDMTGRADALGKIRVDGTPIDYMQVEWTRRRDAVLFPFGHKCVAGKVITIRVENIGEAAADFRGSVHGRLVAA